MLTTRLKVPIIPMLKVESSAAEKHILAPDTYDLKAYCILM